MKKTNLGQFFTKSIVWMKPQVLDFIENAKKEIAIDPFAGGGDLLEASKILGFKKTIGFDIDEELAWEINDGLLDIPKIDGIVITNPPYLAKNSAKRKKMPSYKYFLDNAYVDLYQIALHRILEKYEYAVAIIPETFILTGLFKDRIHSITILEENPFEDTECPVSVVCFAPVKIIEKSYVYKNDEKIGSLDRLISLKKEPLGKYTIDFNDNKGLIGIRCIDGTSENKKIEFCKPDELNYPIENIKVSSRSITVVNLKNLNLNESSLEELIKELNLLLEKYREETSDALLAPFKGNMKNNKRRRRLDFATARAILEEGIENISKKELIHV